jgi:hypothetical protein
VTALSKVPGGAVATHHADGAIFVWDLSSRSLRETVAASDRRRLAAALAEADSGADDSGPAAAAHAAAHAEAAAALGNGRLVTGGASGALAVWRGPAAAPAAAGAHVFEEIAPPRPRRILSLAVLDDHAQRLVSGGRRGVLRLWNLATGDVETVVTGLPGAVVALAPLGGGSDVAVACDDGQLVLVSLTDAAALLAVKEKALGEATEQKREALASALAVHQEAASAAAKAAKAKAEATAEAHRKEIAERDKQLLKAAERDRISASTINRLKEASAAPSSAALEAAKAAAAAEAEKKIAAAKAAADEKAAKLAKEKDAAVKACDAALKERDKLKKRLDEEEDKFGASQKKIEKLFEEKTKLIKEGKDAAKAAKDDIEAARKQVDEYAAAAAAAAAGKRAAEVRNARARGRAQPRRRPPPRLQPPPPPPPPPPPLPAAATAAGCRRHGQGRH